MHSRAFALTAMALVLLVLDARADEPNESATTPKRAAFGGVTVGLGMLVFQPDLREANFSGSGVPLAVAGSDRRVPFVHTGREIGLGRPTLVGIELRADYLRRYIELGLNGFVAGHPGNGIDTPMNIDAARLASSADVTSWGASGHVALAIPTGPFSVIIGPDIGIRGYGVPLRGFAQTTCTTKGRTYACDEAAAAATPYLMPRMTLQYTTVLEGGAGFFVAGWIGTDIVPGFGLAGGLTLGVSSGHATLAI